jgi:hypothetical protein
MMTASPALEQAGCRVPRGGGERTQSSVGHLAHADGSDREQLKNREQLESGEAELQVGQPVAQGLDSNVHDCALTEWIAPRIEMLVAEPYRLSEPQREAIGKIDFVLGLEVRLQVRPTICELFS